MKLHYATHYCVNNNMLYHIHTVLRIGFVEPHYTVVENQEAVMVEVAVFGGQLSEEVSVTLTTEDGTATEACESTPVIHCNLWFTKL